MENLKILMVIAVFDPYVGGAEKQAQNLALELIRRNNCVSVITGRWSNILNKYDELDGLKIIRNRTNFNFYFKDKLDTTSIFFKEKPKVSKYKKEILGIILWKIFVRFCVYIYQLSLFFYLLFHIKSYDIIHVHQVLYPAFISTLCARIFKKPVIAKVGSSGFNSDINQIKKLPEGRCQLRYVLKHIDRIVCTTEKMREDFINEGMDSSRIRLIRNGVKTPDFNRQYEKNTELAYLGRFIKSKDIATLIIAFSKIIEENKKGASRLNAVGQLKLTLIGDGPEKDNILSLIKELGLSKHVILTGMVKNPSEILKEADIFVFPSIIEGLSNSLIEAMASGLPCIATNIPGNIEVMGDAGQSNDIARGAYLETRHGILFNPSDVEGLVNSIIYVLKNKDLRKRIGQNAYSRIKDEFDIQSIAGKYLKLYEELLIQSRK